MNMQWGGDRETNDYFFGLNEIVRIMQQSITFVICPPMLRVIPYLHLAWPGLRQNYPRQFGHGLASLPIYTGSANHALLAKYPIYI